MAELAMRDVDEGYAQRGEQGVSEVAADILRPTIRRHRQGGKSNEVLQAAMKFGVVRRETGSAGVVGGAHESHAGLGRAANSRRNSLGHGRNGFSRMMPQASFWLA
jgi:hypothetical protein